MKALVGAFNQEKALVGAFSVIAQLYQLIDLRHYPRLHYIISLISRYLVLSTMFVFIQTVIISNGNKNCTHQTNN